MGRLIIKRGALLGLSAVFLSLSAHASQGQYPLVADNIYGSQRPVSPVPSANAPGPDRSYSSGQTDLPRNNMTQSAVRARFGTPRRELPAVGYPPISRWVYPDFTVYFEFDRVIIPVSNDVGTTR